MIIAKMATGLTLSLMFSDVVDVNDDGLNIVASMPITKTDKYTKNGELKTRQVTHQGDQHVKVELPIGSDNRVDVLDHLEGGGTIEIDLESITINHRSIDSEKQTITII